jgi:hypothetical protein
MSAINRLKNFANTAYANLFNSSSNNHRAQQETSKRSIAVSPKNTGTVHMVSKKEKRQQHVRELSEFTIF